MQFLPWGKASEDQLVCHPALSSSTTKKRKRKKVCVFMHAWWWCSWALVRMHQSVFLYMLQPSCRQMETSGTTLGVCLLKHPPTPTSTLHHPLPIFPSPSHPPFLSPHPFPPLHSLPFELTKQKEKLQSYPGRPQNLAAGNGSPPLLLRKDKSSPAFDTITQSERGRKHRCNIHMKITRLAAI